MNGMKNSKTFHVNDNGSVELTGLYERDEKINRDELVAEIEIG